MKETQRCNILFGMMACKKKIIVTQLILCLVNINKVFLLSKV